MSQISDTIIQFFTEDNWPYTVVEEDIAYKVNFQGDNGQWVCFAQIWQQRDQFAFYSVFPIKVPEAKRLEVAEFITRANYGLIMGNFELDFRDGEVRYKTSIDVEGDELTPALVKQIVYTNVLMMDRYLPGVMSVVYSNTPPADAVAAIEQ